MGGKGKDLERQPKENPYNQTYRFDDVQTQAELIKTQLAYMNIDKPIEEIVLSLVTRIRRLYGLNNKYRSTLNGSQEASKEAGPNEASTETI